jgi:hypothetical protein
VIRGGKKNSGKNSSGFMWATDWAGREDAPRSV